MKNTDSRSRTLVLVGLFVLITIGLALGVGVTVRRATSTDGTTNRDRVGDNRKSPAHESNPTLDAANDAGLRASRIDAPVTHDGSAVGGSLRIHVIDGVDKKPVPDALCVVYSVHFGWKLYGIVHTDADGRASLSGLPENLILIHVARRPPHASAYAAVIIKKGDTESIEVPLTAGGKIVGRVIDDANVPIADAQVFLDWEQIWRSGKPETEPEIVASSAKDGRFEIPNAVSIPSDTCIVDGQLRAGSWLGEKIRIQFGASEGSAEAQVANGVQVDVGDIVVRRPIACAGRVLDAQHVPVEGALVDVTRVEVNLLDGWQVRRGPLESKGPGRAITGSDGSFRLEEGNPIELLTVITKGGSLQQFIAPTKPGALDDLELVLKDWSILELEFVDESGVRITGTSAAIRDHDIRIASGQRRIAGSVGQIDAILAFDGGPKFHGRFVADLDGLFRFQTTGTTGMQRRLHAELPGFVTVDEVIEAQAGPIERKRFALHPLPVIRVHVSIAPQPERPPDRGALLVQACMMEPAVYAKQVKVPGSQCCGQGATWSALVVAGEQDVQIPVSANGTYWLHTAALIPGKNAVGQVEFVKACVQCVGPCTPGGEPMEIKVPRIEALASTDVHREPLPASGPMSQSMRMRVVDAVTKAGIEDAFVDCNCVPEDRSGQQFLHLDKHGNVKNGLLRPGTYDLAVKSNGYRRHEMMRVTITEGQVVDLGTIALDPLPNITLHVLESDGRPVPSGTSVQMWTSNTESPDPDANWATSVEGAFAFRVDPGPGMMIFVNEPRTGADVEGLRGQQWLLRDLASDTKDVEIRLLPWRSVEVRVAGAIQEYPAASVEVRIAAPGANPDRSGSASLVELLATQDGVRRFRAEVGGPTSVQVALRGGLLQSESQVLEVTDLSALQVFTLSSSH